ncbi:hypothetical protein KR51_00008920 [Rubidibacter lacunae KORDI 51-2]|uniref:Uncharacterized protein n=1 Tax=Rubidibacter lacunae KORDI 51-2 TaxID=582515 RepID=U5DD33_9CHRO|nr:hypothetical protein KR51_00008920 [Rubidibacter lacunae KORDI 51-2]
MGFSGGEVHPFAANETQNYPSQGDEVMQILLATVLLQPGNQLAGNKQGSEHTLSVVGESLQYAANDGMACPPCVFVRQPSWVNLLVSLEAKRVRIGARILKLDSRLRLDSLLAEGMLDQGHFRHQVGSGNQFRRRSASGEDDV